VHHPPPTSTHTGARARSFGTTYAASCRVSAASLAALADAGAAGPRLYDPYLVQDDGSLYPLPVAVTNRPGTASGDGLVRRAGLPPPGAAHDCYRGARLLMPRPLAPRAHRRGRGAATALRTASQPSGHVRRFFFVDDTLAAPAGGAPRAVVYPSAIELRFTVRADKRDHILPPLITIT
jgi:hypothetical protein